MNCLMLLYEPSKIEAECLFFEAQKKKGRSVTMVGDAIFDSTLLYAQSMESFV